MISKLYQFTNNSLFRLISFIIAILATLLVFLNIHLLRENNSVVWVVYTFLLYTWWSTTTMLLHGIGFKFQVTLIQALLLPILAYIGFLIQLCVLYYFLQGYTHV